jgi:GT2 family glycosyltransferase
MSKDLPLRIIIITHLGDEVLRECIRSIKASTVSTEIIVLVSNAQERPLPSGVLGHQFFKNIGYARSVNFAFQQYGELPLLILNDDLVLMPDCLEKLWAAYRSDRILQPEIRFYDDPERIENAGHRIRLDGANHAVSRGSRTQTCKNMSRMAFSGAAFLISPEIIKAVGDFDPELSPFGEDLDYSLRLCRKGFSVQIIQNAVLLHRLGYSFGRFSLEKIICVESFRIQAKLRSMPLAFFPLAPFSTLLRYWQGKNHPLVSPKDRTEAMRGTIIGIIKGYTSLPKALRKRQEDQWALSDWDFLKLWWAQGK